MCATETVKAAPAIAGNDPQINEHLDGSSSSISTTFRHAAEAAGWLRLQFLARHLLALPPKSLLHFLEELERGASEPSLPQWSGAFTYLETSYGAAD